MYVDMYCRIVVFVFEYRLSISAAFPKIRAFDEYVPSIDNIHHDSLDMRERINESGQEKANQPMRFSRSIMESIIKSMLAPKSKIDPIDTDTDADADSDANADAETNGKKTVMPPSGSLCNFKQGMQTLPDAIVSRLVAASEHAVVNTGYRAIRVHFDHGKDVYLSTFRPISGDNSEDGDVTVASDHVVFATPAFVTADILKNSTQSQAVAPSQLQGFDYDTTVVNTRMRSVTLPQAITSRRHQSKTSSDRFNIHGKLNLFSPSVAKLLNEIVYCPVASVISAYPHSLLRNDSSTNFLQAFGHLIPRSTVKSKKPKSAAAEALIGQRMQQQAAKGFVLQKVAGRDKGEKFTTLGTIWSSQLFDGRVKGLYKNHVVFTSFVGGMHGAGGSALEKGGGVLSYCDAKLLKHVDNELMELVGRKGSGVPDQDKVTLSRLYRLSKRVLARRVLHSAAAAGTEVESMTAAGALPSTSGDTSDSPFVSLDESIQSEKKLEPVLLGIKRWERGIPQFEL